MVHQAEMLMTICRVIQEINKFAKKLDKNPKNIMLIYGLTYRFRYKKFSIKKRINIF